MKNKEQHPITEVRKFLHGIVYSVRHKKTRTIITHCGKQVAAIIPMDDLELLERDENILRLSKRDAEKFLLTLNKLDAKTGC